VAATDVQNRIQAMYVIRPVPAVEADLSLPATTQAIQDSIIYARTSGYVIKRYVDIGDHVRSGQLLAEIASVKGLEEMSSLIEPLTAAGAKVQVLSPPRIVITLPASAEKQQQLNRDVR